MTGHTLYACDTPGCTSWKAVFTPDGYVCQQCADKLEQQYESEPELVADGGTQWGELSGFQRDVLEAIARLDSADEQSYGLAIEEDLEDHYDEVFHGRLYQNLDSLIDKGLVERSELDGRTNSYTLTTEAVAMLEESVYRRGDACGLQVTDAGGGEK
ncbi:helix-turn-helix transcriptional regulator [Natrinema altunense]|uniref:PadR family transcriptional regulator n=1 Tax=Natrinema altunense TaxID=222984 RepID=A0A482XUT4_9EURY|nr:helix-turn-helix transcriptional regulator [Natrinema altunense]RZH66522.1 PadR family transcriptional regulator [Natrinema altunense]